MKVTLPKDYKDVYTVSEVEAMRAAIAAMKDYDEKPADILRHVAKKKCEWDGIEGFYGEPISVSVASVETVGKAYTLDRDQICEGSGYTDVVIFGFVNYWKGTLRLFVTISDYWGYEGANAAVTVARYPEI